MNVVVKCLKTMVRSIANAVTGRALKSTNPDFHMALGSAHAEQDRLPQALAHWQRAVNLEPKASDACIAYARLIRQVHPPAFDRDVEQALIACFAAPGFEYQNLAEATARQVRARHGLDRERAAAWAAALGRDNAGTDDQAMGEFLADPLLAALLSRTINVDDELELFLTAARRTLLLAPDAAIAVAEPGLRLMALIAWQSHINGYAFWQDQDEGDKIDRLRGAIEAALAAEPPAFDDLVLPLCRFAMYAPLSRLAEGARLLERPLDSWPAFLQPVLRHTLANAIEEAAIGADIVAIGDIVDATSREVRALYEASPYPCWLAIEYDQPGDIWARLTARFPDSIIHPFPDARREMLVAGCGTGRHPIARALSHPELEILTIDLSKRSLAYAVRMTRKLDVDTVEFRHGDILDLKALGRDFSLIESIGVLHRMADPLAGWRVLSALLRPGGMMKIGLYSEIARRGLIPVRDKIRDFGLRATPEDMRAPRRRIQAGGADEDLSGGLRTESFYHLDELRDLVFHVMEHRFTIPRIADDLGALGLDFIGFELSDDRAARQYALLNPQDPGMTDLAGWAAYEERYPETFIGMYQFWCQRPAAG